MSKNQVVTVYSKIRIIRGVDFKTNSPKETKTFNLSKEDFEALIAPFDEGDTISVTVRKVKPQPVVED